MADSVDETPLMTRALELAARGQGLVEPNPMVGCVVVHDGRIVGEGWHPKFGGPHAEVVALAAAGERARGSALYVTLEPCSHHGKTPPCTGAIIAAGVRRVVAAMGDPFAEVDGQGFRALRAAGVEVEVGLSEAEARRLVAPYLKLVALGRPWVIAKWAMSLDGKIATRQGDGPWISSPGSRAIVHQIRGRVDAIVVGRRTAAMDDPLLTARPPGPRTATRIVLDTNASLELSSRLARTAGEAPLLVAAGDRAPAEARRNLEAAGVEVLCLEGSSRGERLAALFDALGRRRMTNVLVEGGAEVLGELLGADLVDEVHLFIAPNVIGGSGAASPVTGDRPEDIAAALRLGDVEISQVERDVYVRGRVERG